MFVVICLNIRGLVMKNNVFIAQRTRWNLLFVFPVVSLRSKSRELLSWHAYV